MEWPKGGVQKAVAYLAESRKQVRITQFILGIWQVYKGEVARRLEGEF